MSKRISYKHYLKILIQRLEGNTTIFAMKYTRIFFPIFSLIRFWILLRNDYYGTHRGFLEHWNSQKSVSNIWPHFLCLLDEGIPKIWKKLNSHNRWNVLQSLYQTASTFSEKINHFVLLLQSNWLQKKWQILQTYNKFYSLLPKNYHTEK